MHEALALVQRIGGPELLDKVIPLFRASAEERRVKLAAAIADGDLTQASRLAHAMKGSAAQVGAEGLRAAAASLEKEASTLDACSLRSRYERIVEQLAAASAQLDRYRNTVGDAL
jgi:HPt (histidine-containing phosphotransfer) domain-containing protein